MEEQRDERNESLSPAADENGPAGTRDRTAEPAAKDPPAGGAAGTENGGGAGGETRLRHELENAQARVRQLERERVLLSAGVPEEDLDYYAFKIGKLAENGQDFAKAAKAYLREHGLRQASRPVSTGGSLFGHAAKARSTNETMNALLRGN